MKKKESFKKLMREHEIIALSTSYENNPNSRFVNFYYSVDTELIYFATFSDNYKVFELENNNKVSFLTIPKEGVTHVRGKGIAKKSDMSIEVFSNKIAKKVPIYKSVIKTFGEEVFVVYEIDIKDITIIMDIGSLIK